MNSKPKNSHFFNEEKDQLNVRPLPDILWIKKEFTPDEILSLSLVNPSWNASLGENQNTVKKLRFVITDNEQDALKENCDILINSKRNYRYIDIRVNRDISAASWTRLIDGLKRMDYLEVLNMKCGGLRFKELHNCTFQLKEFSFTKPYPQMSAHSKLLSEFLKAQSQSLEVLKLEATLSYADVVLILLQMPRLISLDLMNANCSEFLTTYIVNDTIKTFIITRLANMGAVFRCLESVKLLKIHWLIDDDLDCILRKNSIATIVYGDQSSASLDRLSNDDAIKFTNESEYYKNYL